MSDISHRLIMLRPMQTGASGYARLQSGAGETLLQLNARGLKTDAIRVFWYSGGGEARELGRARVNPRGEASLSTEAPRGGIAPERLQALLISTDGDEPDPLLIGLCVQQSAGSLLDAKNALLALCDKLSRAARERRENEAPAERRAAEAEPPDSREPSSSPPESREPEASLPSAPTPRPPSQTAPQPPREIFLPAIDPMPYVIAGEPGQEPAAPEPKAAPATRRAPPADRLRPLRWPGAFSQLKPFFDAYPPQRLFSLPGWRFICVRPDELWMGYSQTDGCVRRVAYAIRGDQPPPDGRPYRARRGLDGKVYQVLWQRVGP